MPDFGPFARTTTRRAAAVLLLLLALSHFGAGSARAQSEAERSARADVVAFVRAQVGKPYVWGAVGPNAYDCSGLMVAAYRSIHRTIPRTTGQQLQRLRSTRHARPGDLVFGTAGHVAMYIGAGKVVHAPAPGRRIEVSSAAWHMRYAKRTAFK
jgi:cell wall-associated NlpC family hydrolase